MQMSAGRAYVGLCGFSFSRTAFGKYTLREDAQGFGLEDVS